MILSVTLRIELNPLSTHLIRPIHGSEVIRGETLRSHGECMCDLEEWCHGEGFRQVGPQAAEHIIREEDILLDLPVNVFDCSRVRES